MWAILLWCILKKATFENCVGVGAEDTICTICGQKWQHVHLHPFRFVGPNLHKIVFFVGGWVGGFVFFLGGGVPHLALSPPCFCWFVLGFIGVLFVLPFVLRLKFSVSLSFYLACLSVSLSLSFFFFCFCFSLSLSPYLFFLVLFHYYFLVFFICSVVLFYFIFLFWGGGGGRFVCFVT